MTIYTFVANPSSTTANWDDPTIWSGGAVPDDSTADVVLPEVTTTSNGQPYVSTITLSKAYTINSLTIDGNSLNITDGLTVISEVNLESGSAISGDFDAGSIVNDGSMGNAATINCTGSFFNQGQIYGAGLAITAGSFTNSGTLFSYLNSGLSLTAGGFTNSGQIQTNGGALTLTADSFSNTGQLDAGNGDLTLHVTPGGFSNLSGSTLTGGAYGAEGGTLQLDVGGLITVDAANISLTGGGDIASKTAQSGYQSLETTLQDIAAKGSLGLNGVSDSWGDLTVDGMLQLLGGAAPSFAQLTVDTGGIVEGDGSITGPIVDNGTILVTGGSGFQTLKIAGPVTGAGTLEIGAEAEVWGRGGLNGYAPFTLELAAAASANVVFDDGTGTLQLDDPADFTGSITFKAKGDQVLLPNTLYGDVTGYSYSGGLAGGDLILKMSDGTSLDLKLVGDYATAGFALTAIPGTLSSQPATLKITYTGAAAPTVDQVPDHLIVGLLSSETLTENTSGWLQVGRITGGKLAYETVAVVGSEWSLHGTGDFTGGGQSDILMENSSGMVELGQVSNGTTTFTKIGSLAPQWSIEGVGDFLGSGKDQFLLENTSGVVELGSVVGGKAVYATVSALGPEWSFEGVGAFLASGKADFLIENSLGQLAIGEIAGGSTGGSATAAKAGYIFIGAIGPEWKIVESGDFAGDHRAQFLMENTSGLVELGEVAPNGHVQFTNITALGSEWKFVGAGDYRGEGHLQFVIENTSGLVELGDLVNGHVRFTNVSGLGAEWAFHG